MSLSGASTGIVGLVRDRADDRAVGVEQLHDRVGFGELLATGLLVAGTPSVVVVSGPGARSGNPAMCGSCGALRQELVGLRPQLLLGADVRGVHEPTTTTANVVATTSSSRTRRLMAVRDGVTDAPDRVDEARRAVGLGLAPQVPDVDVERLRRGLEVVAPDALVDRLARDDDPRVEHQQLEQVELGLGELELASGPPRLAALRVEHEVGDGQAVSPSVMLLRRRRARTRANSSSSANGFTR